MELEATVEELCENLKDGITKHSSACSDLYASLGEGPVSRILEEGAQTSLDNINLIAAELIRRLNPENQKIIRDSLDLLRKHFSDWEIVNDNGKNPIDALEEFDGIVFLFL